MGSGHQRIFIQPLRLKKNVVQADLKRMPLKKKKKKDWNDIKHELCFPCAYDHF